MERLQYGTWIHAGFRPCGCSTEAGADVPRCRAIERRILMEYFGDEGGAPMLNRVTLPREEAEEITARFHNITLCSRTISCMRLSPYNLLTGRIESSHRLSGGGRCAINPSASSLLGRDLENVCGYFVKYGFRGTTRIVTCGRSRGGGARAVSHLSTAVD